MKVLYINIDKMTSYLTVLSLCDFFSESSPVPLWVQDLVTCCCFVDNFHIQSPAVSTMMDLIILTQSVQVEHKSDSAGTQSSSGQMTVQILPTLHWEDLKFLSDQTQFFRVRLILPYDTFLG